ncbi:MAG: hypothetical protein AAB681_01605 [Patescibacteria group bacterium]
MKKYYISYVVDGGNPLEVFKIIEARSIGDTYMLLCQTQGAHYHGEVPVSEDDAIMRIRKSLSCSVNFCFLLPTGFQSLPTDKLTRIFSDMPIEVFASHFETSEEKIVRTGISNQYPELKELFLKAEKPLKNIGSMNRKFERTFLPNTWFNKRTGP